MPEKKSIWPYVGATLTGVASLITAGIAVYQLTNNASENTDSAQDRTTATETQQTAAEEEKCASPWVYDDNREICVKRKTIGPKTISIPLDQTASAVSGRIDIYFNQERRPGANSQGQAIYQPNPGAVQFVIPVMAGSRQIGDFREVVYKSQSGEKLCEIENAPETTGHLKAMRVSYSVLLEECSSSAICGSVALRDSGRRIKIETTPLDLIVSPDC